jgi:hypothetical protein
MLIEVVSEATQEFRVVSGQAEQRIATMANPSSELTTVMAVIETDTFETAATGRLASLRLRTASQLLLGRDPRFHGGHVSFLFVLRVLRAAISAVFFRVCCIFQTLLFQLSVLVRLVPCLRPLSVSVRVCGVPRSLLFPDLFRVLDAPHALSLSHPLGVLLEIRALLISGFFWVCLSPLAHPRKPLLAGLVIVGAHVLSVLSLFLGSIVFASHRFLYTGVVVRDGFGGETLKPFRC